MILRASNMRLSVSVLYHPGVFFTLIFLPKFTDLFLPFEFCVQ